MVELSCSQAQNMLILAKLANYDVIDDVIQ